MSNSRFTIPLIQTEAALFEQMSTPTAATIAAVAKIQGPVLILGVGGKMGPSLAELLVRSGLKSVIGVDLFPEPAIRTNLEHKGVTCLQGDLLDSRVIEQLPAVTNIFLLAGFKFGASGKAPFTWAMNTLLPARIMEKFPRSQIIYLSSGNVYAYIPVASGGSLETSPIEPVGEYAQSRLGGERLVEFYSHRNGTPVVIVRLFYATELRYGVISDIAQKIKHRQPIDLTTGHFNQIWQGDAVNYLAQFFPLCATPAKIINLTAPVIYSTREIATQLGDYMDLLPIFTGQEAATELMGNVTELMTRFEPPAVTIDQMIQWVAWWTLHEQPILGKPTKFQARDGKY
ncbi:NAD(P)-dependent oxidoreductase [candidate division KSB1 bacterium]|nr:NAD(P)-dependent oxidoreductase [candidate division KSB1 bacterium]